MRTSRMPARREDPVGDLLVIIELTEIAARVPAGARELWTLDCAGRAVGVDIRELDRHMGSLRACLARARAHVLAPEPEPEPDAVDDLVQTVREVGRALRLEGNSNRNLRAIAAVDAALFAIDGVFGRSDPTSAHEAVARRAQAAFEDPDEEALAQARRLLLRTKLIPSGAELLVRLDYAEAHGALPPGPGERAWLDGQRARLMMEDQDSRFAVTLRYLELVFLGELARAP